MQFTQKRCKRGKPKAPPLLCAVLPSTEPVEVSDWSSRAAPCCFLLPFLSEHIETKEDDFGGEKRDLLTIQAEQPSSIPKQEEG